MSFKQNDAFSNRSNFRFRRYLKKYKPIGSPLYDIYENETYLGTSMNVMCNNDDCNRFIPVSKSLLWFKGKDLVVLCQECDLIASMNIIGMRRQNIINENDTDSEEEENSSDSDNDEKS